MVFRILFFMLPFCNVLAQDIYPTDYFRSPLDIKLVLGGTFGELRDNHFHAGLDIKTKQQEGLPIYAIADGYVSRIKVNRFGYGKALYIKHPNGYTSVYGHLQKFADTLEHFIKQKQYEEESFEVEFFPNPDSFPITKSTVIAYSGNTGSSGGPHLHFEIRDNAERPINPLFFGYPIEDTKAPSIISLFAYPISKNAHINNSTKPIKLRLSLRNDGTYTTEKLYAYGTIGFAIETIDKQDLAANKNGVFKIESSFNGATNFCITFKRFSFNETKHINQLIDYAYYKNENTKLQKLFIEKNNSLSMYSKISNEGYLAIENQTTSVYKIEVSDYAKNKSVINLPIFGKKIDTIKIYQKPTSPDYLYANQDYNFTENNFTVTIPKNTFYSNFFTHFKAKGDTLFLQQDTIPTQKYFTIHYDLKAYHKKDISKLYIAELIGYNDFPKYITTKRKGTNLSAKTKKLGKYALALDTIAPTITPFNFTNNKWMSKYKFLKVKIEDKETGISNYRATINNQWILMEYDYKTQLLTYNFEDNVPLKTKNNFKLIVTDNVGNNTTFESVFYRK